MTIQELAQQYADIFIYKKRENGESFIALRKDDETLTTLIRNAHGDMLPDDYKYEYVHNALEAITQCELEDDIIDISMEPDCYNSDLLKWLSSNLTRSNYVDETVLNFGYSSLFQTLMLAQQLEREEVLHSVVESLTAICGKQSNDN
jgi:hypothetical protein